MVGYDDAFAADLKRLLGVLDTLDSFDQEGLVARDAAPLLSSPRRLLPVVCLAVPDL